MDSIRHLSKSDFHESFALKMVGIDYSFSRHPHANSKSPKDYILYQVTTSMIRTDTTYDYKYWRLDVNKKNYLIHNCFKTLIAECLKGILPVTPLWRHLHCPPLRREHRSVALRMRFGKMRTDFLCRFLQWQLRMDAPEPADGKTLAIFLHEIELGKRQRGRVFG